MDEPPDSVADSARPSRALSALLWICALFLVCAVSLRLGPRDALWGPSILFYATPWPVLAALATAATWLSAWARRPRWTLCWALSAWALTAAFLATAWNHPIRSVERYRVRVLYWNVDGGSAGAEALASRIAAHDADIVCLGEAGPPNAVAFQDELERALPTHRRLARSGNAWIGARRWDVSPAAPLSIHRLEGLGGALCLALDVAGHPLYLALVDLRSKPWLEREEGIAALRELLPERDWVALGDFNTPLASASFDAWRAEGRHAFERAGGGYRPTWPLPLPVLTLDHLWTGPGVRALRADAHASGCSDHRALVVDLGWEPAPGE